MGKRSAISKDAAKAPKSEAFQTFERGLRTVLSVSKKDVDAKVEAEKRSRANGNGASAWASPDA
jgi:hypothetical protein